MKKTTFLLIILHTCRLYSQTTSSFEKLSVEQGLSNVAVYSLLQDRQGFIWMGTQGGLNRFDGYRFVNYDRDPEDPNSLRDNFIACLLEDHKGYIWAGTRQGLSRFDKATGQFANFPFPASDPQQQLFNHVMALVEKQDGNLWVGTTGGLVFFDVSKKEFRSMPLQAEKNAGKTPLRINALALDGQGILWIGSESGLLRFNPADGLSRKVSPASGERLPPVRSLCDDGKGTLWIGTSAGAYRFDKSAGQFKLSGATVQIATMMKDSRGRLLVGTLRGIEILDPQSGAFHPFLKDESQGGWFKATRPQTILEDRNHTYWIATFSDGVYHLDPSPKKFRHFHHQPDNPHTLHGNFVIGLCEDSRGKVWVGTDSDLNILDPASGRFSTFSKEPLGMVRSVFEDKDGTMWAGTPHGIVRQALGKAAVYLRYDRNDPQPRSPGLATKAIFQDSEGILWFGGGDGLFRHEPGSELFQPLAFTQISTDTNIIYHITEDKFSNLWVSTSNGLVRFDKTRRVIRHFLHDPGNPSSLSDNNISSVLIAKNGQIWVASYDGGLEKYHAETESFTHYRRKNGLPDEKIWGLLEDDQGFLWLSSSRGLSRFDPDTQTIRNFDVEDGLQGYEFTIGAYHKGKKSGNLYFGGANGFNVFHPDSLQYNQTPPPVVFTVFRYHKGSLEETAFSEIPGISAKSEVLLPYPAQTIVCEFAALDFRQSDKNRYAYRLQGLHQNWVDLGTKREVTFANLRPGTYKLLVKASNNDGVWSEKDASLRIVVLPPWWMTWWAYGLYALAIGTVVRLAYKYQLRQKLQQQEALRLKELDDFKNRFFTNITHEFRTPLTVILGTSEQLLSRELGMAVGSRQSAVGAAEDEIRFQKSKFQNQIGLIRRNGENLLRLINQILDLAKLESNTLKIKYVQGDVLPYLRYIAESLHSLANAQNVMLRVESSEAQIVMDYDPERLLSIAYNLLSNAIKFTPSGGRVTLGVNHGDFKNHHDLGTHLLLSVSDTGVGIPPEDLPRIFDRFFQANNSAVSSSRANSTGGTGIGLALTKELVHAMGGEVSVESEMGKGTVFTVKLPITKQAATSDPVTWEVSENLGGNFPKGTPSEKLPPKLAMSDTEQASLLLIEDNPDVVEYLAACLQGSYALDFAYNGRAGIEKALETVPDLIVSDVMMPEKDGFEVCDFLKNDERTSHIPIVLLTAKADVESRLTGLRRGADAYLSKPFHQEELMVTLNNLLEIRRKLQAKYGDLSAVASRNFETGAPSSLPPSREIGTGYPSLEDAFLQKARAVILERLSDSDFTVDDFCHSLGMSQSQLHRKLTALTTKNATVFIRSIRLAKAKELLSDKTMNVSEVAYAVGFDDPKYFSRVFAEQFGVAPSKI